MIIINLIIFLIVWLINSYFIAHLKTAYFDLKVRKNNAIWRYCMIASIVVPPLFSMITMWFAR